MSPALQGGFTAPPGKSLNVLLISEQGDYMMQREKVKRKKRCASRPKITVIKVCDVISWKKLRF